MALLPSLLCMGRKAESLDTISARRAFMEMPVGVLDLLSKDARFDMLAYYDNDSIYLQLNNLKGESFLEKVTDDFLSVRLTNVSTLQIKILELSSGEDIIMTVYTTGRKGEALDSDISFYDTNFEELPKEKYFPTPKISDFFQTKNKKISMKDIENIMPFYTIWFQASPDNSNVRGSITLDDIMTTEDRALVEDSVKPSVTFVWNGKSFKTASN